MTIMTAAPKHLTGPFLFGPLTGLKLTGRFRKSGTFSTEKMVSVVIHLDEDIYRQQKMLGFRPSFTISHQLLLSLSVKTKDNYICVANYLPPI